MSPTQPAEQLGAPALEAPPDEAYEADPQAEVDEAYDAYQTYQTCEAYAYAAYEACEADERVPPAEVDEASFADAPSVPIMDEPLPQPLAKSGRASSPWHCFLAKRRAEGMTMRAAGAEWRSLGSTDRAQFVDEAREHQKSIRESGRDGGTPLRLCQWCDTMKATKSFHGHRCWDCKLTWDKITRKAKTEGMTETLKLLKKLSQPCCKNLFNEFMQCTDGPFLFQNSPTIHAFRMEHPEAVQADAEVNARRSKVTLPLPPPAGPPAPPPLPAGTGSSDDDDWALSGEFEAFVERTTTERRHYKRRRRRH